ncbi:MAG: class II fructose-bisphosphate aldolase, partial [Oscillospiraceae bacterium]|nr:class II fructose-bisphosphate aldolase [Oscillospiraceae bacterium]
MLVSMKEMLADARKNYYALPAFDVSNYEMMKAVLDACEEEGSPALLMGLGVDLGGRAMDLMASMVASASKFYSIPVCFHLDHATDFELIKRAIDAGFSSVMYDGSVLDFENNAKNTAEVTKYAHERGVTVEAELGHVGNASVGSISETGTDTDPGETLTVPEEVAKFVEITDVDALAVAIGTSHGVYQKTPELRIDRL